MTAERSSFPIADDEPDAEARARQEKLDALARLSGCVAHDFNNILHVIKNATDLLRRKVPDGDAEAAWLLDMLNRNAGRGTRLTRELLAFAARLPLEPVAVNPNRLIADMQDRLRESLGRTISVDTILGGGLDEVCVDPEELATAILNLVLNGRDAMAGSGRIVVETANVAIDPIRASRAGIVAGDYVSIAVSDSGHGMTPETLARAFDPYFTTKEAASLTGFGLSRVCGFVKQSNGSIEVETIPAKGTKVTLYLPRRPAPEASPVAETSVAESKVVSLTPQRAHPARSLSGLRVLVVEDESLIGMLAEDLLEQLGCRMVGLISSLDRALDVAKNADIDFALLDVDIGGTPVYPVASALQARGVPFVFMSGYGGLEGPWLSQRVVQKPFDIDQLRREIESSLRAG